MSLLSRASARYLLAHPTQLALSVLGVALGVAVMVAMDLAIQSSREAFRVSTETVAGRATHTLTAPVGGLDETLFGRLRLETGLREAAPVVEGIATSPALPGRALRVLGVDPFSEGPFRPFLAGGETGVDVSALMTVPGGVVLSSVTAGEAGVGAGDTLAVRVDGRARVLRVVGVLDPGDRLARLAARDLLVLDLASAQELLGSLGRLSRIDLRLPDGAEGARILERASSILPPGVSLEPAGTRTQALAGMIRAFDLNLTALSLLGLLFGMFLIYNAMTFSVVRRREMLGALRALGVTRAEVMAGILREAAWTGLAGSVAGAAMGVVLGRGLVTMVTRTINDLYFVVSVEGLAIPPLVLAKGVGLGVGATLLAALAPAYEAAKAPPRAAQLRSVGESAARRAVPRAALAGMALLGMGAGLLFVPTRALGASFTALFLVILGMALLTPLGTVLLVGGLRPLLARGGGILGTLAARGVVAALSRTAPAVASLVVAVSVTVGLGVMIQSFRGTLTRWLGATLQADVYVSLPSAQASRADGTLDPAALAALVSHPAVDGWSSYRGVEVVGETGPFRLIALALDPRGEGSIELLEGDPTEAFGAFRAGRGVLVSEPFAFRRGIGLGDAVALPGAGAGGVLPVAGVFRDYATDQGVVMVERGVYDALYDDDGVTSLALFLAQGADADAVVGELAASAPPGQEVVVRTNAALRSGSLEVFDRTFQVTAVLRLLAFVVAFVGVLAALMALELERARELGVLRANGLTPGQLRGLVTVQTALLGSVAGLLALPVGLVLSWVMIHVVNRRSFGWTLSMDIEPAVLLQAVGLALGGALLAGIYPAWRMGRASPAAALRGE